MKTFVRLSVFTLVLLGFSCKKNNSGPSLTNEERKLLGNWQLKKRTIEETGQPTIVDDINSPNLCFMGFEERASSLIELGGLYSNTKWVQDNKDCNWLANAWRIEDTGQLLLASLDTIHADILINTADTLAFKATNPHNSAVHTTYQFSK